MFGPGLVQRRQIADAVQAVSDNLSAKPLDDLLERKSHIRVLLLISVSAQVGASEISRAVLNEHAQYRRAA
jgi:hypothetical protein